MNGKRERDERAGSDIREEMVRQDETERGALERSREQSKEQSIEEYVDENDPRSSAEESEPL